MVFHEDLLAQAEALIRRGESDHTQADLRRAVSTAYYALFHLLIAEASQNWSRESSRAAFGRMFEHSVMRKALQRLRDSRRFPFIGEDAMVVDKLKAVADSFVRLQDSRHIADYHNGVEWALAESAQEVGIVRDAFQIWATIREENIAQDYLVSLLIKPRD